MFLSLFFQELYIYDSAGKELFSDYVQQMVSYNILFLLFLSPPLPQI